MRKQWLEHVYTAKYFPMYPIDLSEAIAVLSIVLEQHKLEAEYRSEEDYIKYKREMLWNSDLQPLTPDHLSFLRGRLNAFRSIVVEEQALHEILRREVWHLVRIPCSRHYLESLESVSKR
jgi:hypothetical protein